MGHGAQGPPSPPRGLSDTKVPLCLSTPARLAQLARTLSRCALQICSLFPPQGPHMAAFVPKPHRAVGGDELTNPVSSYLGARRTTNSKHVHPLDVGFFHLIFSITPQAGFIITLLVRGNRSSEWLSNLPRITQLLSRAVRI